jgi:hypothetical protein
MSDLSENIQRLLEAADAECNIFAGGAFYAQRYGLAPFQSPGDWLAWMLHDAHVYESMAHQAGETLADRMAYRETAALLRKHADALLASGVSPTPITWPSGGLPEVSHHAQRFARSRLAELCARVQLEYQQGELVLAYLGRVLRLWPTSTQPTIMGILPHLLEQAESTDEEMRGRLTYLLGEDYEVFVEVLAEAI